MGTKDVSEENESESAARPSARLRDSSLEAGSALITFLGIDINS